MPTCAEPASPPRARPVQRPNYHPSRELDGLDRARWAAAPAGWAPWAYTDAGLPVAPTRVARRPRVRPAVLSLVFLGGCAGGAARYAVTTDWPGPATRFPWATFAVNTAGSFLLGLIVVVAADVLPRRFLRPLLGTGFCGAFTTFSAVVVSVVELVDDHDFAVAVGYSMLTALAGLAAGWLGLTAGRALAETNRYAVRRKRSRA